jgi:hypothetical protein
MAEQTPSVAAPYPGQGGGRRRWWPFLVVVLSVAAEMVLGGMPVDPAVRPAIITAITALAGTAVLVSLAWSMGLARESLTLRLIAAIPLLLSVALIVVLMLEYRFRAGHLLPGAGAGAGAGAGG